MVNFENTCNVPTYEAPNLNNIRNDITSMLDDFDGLESDTMLCIITYQKNTNGTYTASMAASTNLDIDQVNIGKGAIESLQIKRR